MVTITGTITDAQAQPLRAIITWTPASPPFPYIGAAGAVSSTLAIVGASNAVDGSWTFTNMEPGTYTVLFQANGANVGQFQAVVPSSGGPYTFDQVVSNVNPPQVSPLSGTGSPEGVVTGVPGQIYTDVTNHAFYIKEAGTGTTGWQAYVQL